MRQHGRWWRTTHRVPVKLELVCDTPDNLARQVALAAGRRDGITSVPDCQEALDTYIAAWNEPTEPFARVKGQPSRIPSTADVTASRS